MARRPLLPKRARPPLRLIDCAKQRMQAQQHGTVCVLRALLADAEAGELAGILLSYRKHDGAEDIVYTGVFKDRPAEAIQAAMCASLRLVQLHDEGCGPAGG